MSGQGAGLAGVFQALEQDLVTAEVLSAFDAASIPAILLKGPTFAEWLYAPDEIRSYADSDLLVPRRRFRDGERVLRGLGFERSVPGRCWRHVHGVGFERGDRQVDLHHTLGLVDGSFDVWAVLAPTATVVRVAGRAVPALDEPARCLHVALHAAQSRHRFHRKSREDLRRALDRAGADAWAASARLARALGCEPELAAGLRTLDEGRRRAEQLGLTDEPSARLEAARAPLWRRHYRLVRGQRSWRGKAAQLGAGLGGALRRARHALRRRRPPTAPRSRPA